ncbi:MAG: hypothetical protein LC792_15455 [Actinobacteria bacterium]|nr:hypothetical protein [Actinomycetota bacterium]
MTGTAGSYQPPAKAPVYGWTEGPNLLSPVPDGDATVWTDVPGAQVTLPEAGTYDLDVVVNGTMTTTAAVTDAALNARFWDQTKGLWIGGSWATVVQYTSSAAGAVKLGSTSTVSAQYTVTGPTVVRAQGQKVINAGSLTQKDIAVRSFRYRKISAP